MSADRNLLFGMLALHNGFVSRDQLLEAMHAWMLHKDKPLGALLHEQGVLQDDDVRMLDGLVARHVGKHGDVQKSLASLRIEPAVQHEISRLADPDVRASVASVWPETTSPTAQDSGVPRPTPRHRPRPATRSATGRCICTPKAGWGRSTWRWTRS